jgi:hypothetical protein
MGPFASALVGAAGKGIGGAIGNAIGGLLGRNDEDEWVSSEELFRFRGIRKQAERAGFNPLTALRATGGGTVGYTGGQAPQLGSNAFIGDAIGNVIATAFNRPQIMADAAAEEIKLQTMKEELAALQRANAAPAGQSFGYSIPQVVDSVGNETVSGPTLGRPGTHGASANPTLNMRTDGLTGVNNEDPVEVDGDLWAWAREGSLLPNVWEVYKRNTMTDWQRQNVETVKEWAGDIFTAPAFSAPSSNRGKRSQNRDYR